MSATSIAPASSQRGRSPRNASSITHCVKGSPTTGARSGTPVSRSAIARSASVVAGTIRSTIVHGKSAPDVSHSSPTSSRSTSPLRGTLSQETTASGAPGGRAWSPRAICAAGVSRPLT